MTQDEDLNVKKDRPPVRPMRLPVGPIRRTLFATSELMRGFSLASADGWRAFSNAVDPEVSSDEDLARDVTDAMFDANRRYFEDVGATSRRFVDAILDEGAGWCGSCARDRLREAGQDGRGRDAASRHRPEPADDGSPRPRPDPSGTAG